MRKLNKGRKLNREKGPRKALLKSLANSFFAHEKITTTEAKAKELRVVAEKMITRAKKGGLANSRILATELNKPVVAKLNKEIAARYAGRQGGYTRIIKLGPRPSDGARMVIIELVK